MEWSIVKKYFKLASGACLTTEDLSKGLIEEYLGRVEALLHMTDAGIRLFFLRFLAGEWKQAWPPDAADTSMIRSVAEQFQQGEDRDPPANRLTVFIENEFRHQLFSINKEEILVIIEPLRNGEPELFLLDELTGIIRQSAEILSAIYSGKMTRAPLQPETRLLQAIFDHYPDPVYVKDLEGRKIMANQAEVELLQADSPEDVIGNTDAAFYPEAVALRTRYEEEQLIMQKMPAFYGEHTILNRSGEEIWLEGKKVPYTDEHGNILGIMGFSRNITASKRAASELLESRDKFRSIFNSFPDLYFRADLTGIILEISPSVFEQSGYRPEEVMGRSAELFYSNLERRAKMIKILMEKGSVNDYENIMVKKDGTQVPVSFTCHIKFSSQGQPLYIEGSIRDITERKLAEEKMTRLLRLQNMISRMATGFINIPLDVSDHAVNDLLALAGSEYEIDRVYVFRYDFAAGTMSNTHEWCAEGIMPEIGNLQDLNLELAPEWVRAHMNGEMIMIPDVSMLPAGDNVRKTLEPQGIITLVTIPMIIDKECLGFVGFDSVRRVKVWEKEEIAILKLLADLLCNFTDRRQTEHALKTREAYLKAVFDNVPFHMWLKDEDGRYLLVNKPFIDYFSMTDQDLPLGKTDTDLWPQEIADEFSRQDKLVISSGKLNVVECNLNYHGKKVWFEMFRAPIVDQNGKFLGTFGIANDVTKRIRDDAELKKASAEAQAANVAKSRFLANMSHEIRTPLNAIIGMIRLLLESKVDTAQIKLLHIMKSSSESLLSIINDILDFSKIESGQIELSLAVFNLPEILRKVYDTHEFRAEDKEIRLYYHIDPAIDTYYLGDTIRLQQILNNLISNAIKFTSEGEVEINLTLASHTPDKDTIRFLVRDTGIGISPENHAKIFQSFQQEDESITRTFGGTGLGLAISKQLVELMGGQLMLESAKDEGSKFFFSVTLSRGEKPAAEQELGKILSSSPTLQGVKILLAEDNKFNQFIAQAILEKWKAQVKVAGDGQQAINILRTESFDIILMDIQMPVMDGITATTIIRQELGLRVPVIALTANVVKGVVERCKQAGMQDYISKPFEEEQLYARICLALGDRLPAGEENIATESLLLTDISKLSKMVNDDPRMLGMMIRKFIDVTPEYVSELRSAAENGDNDGIGRMTHKLKSAIDLVAGNRIRDMLEEISKLAKSDASSEELIRRTETFAAYYRDMVEQLNREIPPEE